MKAIPIPYFFSWETMDAKKAFLFFAGIFLQFIGWLYALLPHAFHEELQIGFNLGHAIHTLIGILLVVVGVIFLVLHKKI